MIYKIYFDEVLVKEVEWSNNARFSFQLVTRGDNHQELIEVTIENNKYLFSDLTIEKLENIKIWKFENCISIGDKFLYDNLITL